ncbi:hypothetical protein KI387_011353, partial [Taxus chinensis]
RQNHARSSFVRPNLQAPPLQEESPARKIPYVGLSFKTMGKSQGSDRAQSDI